MIKFIADVGSNHNGDLSRCYELIDKAKDIGCWGVKFQLFKADKLYSNEFKDKIEAMKKWELPREFISHIAEYCNIVDIHFVCTPFSVDDIDFLSHYVDWLKIGSYELLNHKLIKEVASSQIPWILSVGMATNKEINDALEISSQCMNPPRAILHCNSNYPASTKHCDISRIARISMHTHARFNAAMQYGWSDHTTDKNVIYDAVNAGASMVEFHIDLPDGEGYESQFGHCWHPDKIEEVIEHCELMKPKEYDPSDEQNRKWRMDPIDGKRPLKVYRKELRKL
jgi:sialic acid synthase SpsE